MNNSSLPAEMPDPGLRLAGVLTLLLVLGCAAVYVIGGGALEAVRTIDRWTIRIAVLLFSLAFAGPACASLFPGRISRWLLANGRNFTVAFVTAFVLHLLAIGRFYVLDAPLFWSSSPVPLIVLRSIGVVFIALMLLTALGCCDAGRWKRWLAFGSVYVWGAFMAGFAKRIPLDAFYILPVTLLLAVMLLTLIDRGRRAWLAAERRRSWL